MNELVDFFFNQLLREVLFKFYRLKEKVLGFWWLLDMSSELAGFPFGGNNNSVAALGIRLLR